MINRWMITGLYSILIPCLLTGCWGAREINHTFYAHAIGIDFHEGQYEFYVQIINFATIAGSEASVKGKDAPGAKVGKGTGETITEALQDSLKNSQRSIYWGHVNTIVLTENLLKHGIGDVLDLLSRYHEFRDTSWIFLIKDPMDKILLTLPIISETAFSLLSDPHDIYRQNSIVEPIRLHRFNREWEEPAQTINIPLASIVEDAWTTEKGKKLSVTIDGFGMVQGKKFKGSMKGQDISGLRWLQQGTDRAAIVVQPSDGSPLASVVLDKPKKRVQILYKNGDPQFIVHVKLKGNVFELNDKHVLLSQIEKETESQIKAEIEKSAQAAIRKKADIMQLSHSLYRKNPKVWRKHTTHGELDVEVLKTATIKVSVDLKSSLGLKMKP